MMMASDRAARVAIEASPRRATPGGKSARSARAGALLTQLSLEKFGVVKSFWPGNLGLWNLEAGLMAGDWLTDAEGERLTVLVARIPAGRIWTGVQVAREEGGGRIWLVIYPDGDGSSPVGLVRLAEEQALGLADDIRSVVLNS